MSKHSSLNFLTIPEKFFLHKKKYKLLRNHHSESKKKKQLKSVGKSLSIIVSKMIEFWRGQFDWNIMVVSK